MPYTIYVVEDEENIRELITATLLSAQYDVSGFENAQDFYQALEKKTPHLILLDIMMPQENGLKVLQKLKTRETASQIPVIFLTAKSTELDIAHGLNLGADDYIVKPFSVLEFIARVNAVIRRYHTNQDPTIPTAYKDLVLDTNEKTVYKEGEKITLTYKEYSLLYYLYQNRGIVLSREKILNQVWGFSFDGETRTVDAHIRSLRSKLKDNFEDPIYIATVRGHGYILLRDE